MPDPLPPSGGAPSDDELVSAYLDGEATAAEISRVEADADLMAQVEAMRAVAAVVATPPLPPTDEVRDGHIAAALAASRTAPNVTSLGAARAARTPWYRQPVAAVAAVIVAALVAVPLLSQLGGSDADNDVAGSAASDDGGDEASGEPAEAETRLEERAALADAEAAPAASTTGASPQEEAPGDAATDDGGDGGDDATAFGPDAANQQRVAGRLLPQDGGADGDGFSSFPDLIDAYTRFVDGGEIGAGLADDVDAAAACLASFDPDEPVAVATVADTDVLVGTANGDVLIVDVETCDTLFPAGP